MSRWPAGPALALLPLGLSACGVVGAPRPPSRSPPSLTEILSTPDGLELTLADDRPTLLHLPAGPPQPIQGRFSLPRPGPEGLTVRLSAADPVTPGRPGPPLTLRWSPPPPPPPAPMAFLGAGQIQIIWLPAPPDTREIHLLRDDQLDRRLPPGQTEAVDPAPPPGVRRYRLRYQTSAARTEASPAATVIIPPP